MNLLQFHFLPYYFILTSCKVLAKILNILRRHRLCWFCSTDADSFQECMSQFLVNDIFIILKFTCPSVSTFYTKDVFWKQISHWIPWIKIKKVDLLKAVGNKAIGRISKRVFQENIARQIFRKTYVCVSGGKKCSFFRKIWRALFS